MSKSLFFTTLLIIISFHYAQSQIEEEINVVGLRLLDYNNIYLPEDILQQRAAVFVSVPQKSAESSERGDWKKFSQQAHEYFKKIGVDAVAYFYLDDILAGPDASANYSNYLKDRQIKYIIILSKVLLKIGSRIDTTHVVVVTGFNGDASFISNGQKAWKDQNKDLDKIMKNIYRITVKQEFKRTNNLIIDQPEFIEGINITTVRRNESFPSDIRVDKLAVPKYTDYKLPSDIPDNTLNKRIEKEIEKSNEINQRLNQKIEYLFQGYPWKYELVDYNVGEDQLFKDGFQFVLLRLNTSGNSIREMLGYELKPGETDYITIKKKPDGTVTFRSIPIGAPVYKFYIKQLTRKEIYIGETWDADESWEDALLNFLSNLKEKLK
jgi:hypothetical protein